MRLAQRAQLLARFFFLLQELALSFFSIYTLNDLGNSSNLIGSLSQTMTLYSPRQAVNIKQNKIAVVNWVFCQSFKVKPF